jgi:transcriptional regulator with XRE-family HTH domain
MSDQPERTHDAAVGAQLRAMRLRYVLKQEELAAALGVKHAAISRWERGERGLSVDMLLTIAERFGVPAAELLPEDHRAPAAPPQAPAPPAGQQTPQDAAIASIIHVLREQPELILQVIAFIEQQAMAEPNTIQ